MKLEFSKGVSGNTVYVQNLQIPSDTLDVVVTDTLGWLSGPTAFTLTLEGLTGGSQAVTVVVPATATYGTVDEVWVTAASRSEPGTSDWDTFQVEAVAPCIPLEGASIGGPPTTTVGAATPFTATAEPFSATLPITWRFSDSASQRVVTRTGGLSDTAVFTWGVSGPQTVTVTAVNPCGVEVSATHPITVEAAPSDWWKVYLPLVVRKVSAPEGLGTNE